MNIKTFHSYSFDLVGQQGTLEEAANIVSKAAEMIENGEVEESKIAKSVLVIDEAQDMGADDFRLVTALMQRNEEMRVIAVGDDDQNIYAFRGSDSAYLKSLISTYNAKLYELTLNYRSDQTIVTYSNQFAKRLANRMKHRDITSNSPSQGQVDTNADIAHLSEHLQNNGTSAVLTLTNEQALQVAHILRQQGKHVRFVQNTDGFQFANLAEVRYFLKQIGSGTKEGTIDKEQWHRAKEQTEARYSSSQCMGMMHRFFADYEQTHKSYYHSDLKEFILESSVEDFIATEKNVVFVSTIHKAKGREFDNVCLLLDNTQTLNQERLRTIYVGITRAKHNLYVYQALASLQTLPTMVLSLSMHDVWLDYFRDKKEQVLALRSGDQLQYQDGFLLSNNGQRVARLSIAKRNQIKDWEKRGYFVADAEISYILAWRPQNGTEEIAVCLANLVLSSADNNMA